jgi:photosynthetic reaction center H subunit
MSTRSHEIGDPIAITGDPMGAGVGPGAWANRSDTPDPTIDGRPKIVPLRADATFYLEPRDPDPRGMTVIALDGEAAGTVAEVWVDRSEPQVRYLEVLVASTGRLVLLPITFCRFDVESRKVRVKAIKAKHFAAVPTTKSFNQVTLLEEDKIQAYYGGGYLYADPARLEPFFA